MKDAENLLTEAREKAVAMLREAVNNVENMQAEAEKKAQEKMDSASKWSLDLKTSASKYVDELVNETEYRISKSLDEIRALQNSMKKAAQHSPKQQPKTSQK